MNETDKRQKLQQCIAEDINSLKRMAGEDDTLVRGYLKVIASRNKKAAREMLSLLTRITDNITRLENLAQGNTNSVFHYDALAYQSLGQVAALFVAAERGSEAQR